MACRSNAVATIGSVANNAADARDPRNHAATRGCFSVPVDELRRRPDSVSTMLPGRSTPVVEALVGPAKRVRRDDHVVHREQGFAG
jgi:hypothetical protein